MRWHHFLEQEVQFSLSDSEKHTKAHCARVLLFALLIADKMDLPQKEREALCAAAAFHDSRRQDDWLDVGHGQRAADYYRDYCQTHSLPFDNRVYLVMAFHDRDDLLGEAALAEQENGVLLYHIFKDADALDRCRLHRGGLNPDWLRYRESKRLIDFMKQICVKTRTVNKGLPLICITQMWFVPTWIRLPHLIFL